MNFLRDPFTQFMVNSILSLVSIIVATVSLFLAMPPIKQKQFQTEMKLPNTAPLPAQPLSFSGKLALFTFALIALYCFFEVIAAFFFYSPYPKWMIFVFAGGGLYCLFLLTPSGRRLFQKGRENKELSQKKEVDETPNQRQ